MREITYKPGKDIYIPNGYYQYYHGKAWHKGYIKNGIDIGYMEVSKSLWYTKGIKYRI